MIYAYVMEFNLLLILGVFAMRLTIATIFLLGFLLVSNSFADIYNISAIHAVPGSGSQYAVNLMAGNYTATIVNPEINSDADFWAWNYRSGWLTGWGASIGNSGAYDIVGGLGGPENAKGTEQLAYQEAANQNRLTTTFELSTDSTLHFFVLDNLTSDNGGGVSLDITSSVPVPSAILLLGSGILGLAGVSRRKK